LRPFALRTIQPWPYRPGIVPSNDREQRSTAYGKFSFWLRRVIIEAARVVNIVQYIPVAEATAGCIPCYINSELKIVPGAIPAKPENSATMNAIMAILKIVFGENY